MDKFIDVVIPRGGKSLILAVSKLSKIPIFKHLDGNCHTYIHEKADFAKARKILLNAKMRRVGICGATESVLIDKKIASKIIPILIDDLTNLGCEVRGSIDSRRIDKRIKKASIKDFYTEYLDKILSLKIVENIDEAISHIAKFGSAHTESIITEDQEMAQKFLNEVNSAIVMHNASTQFADGGEFGFGAEVGIATGKIHARGPVGLEQLTIYKYQIVADCAIRQ
jgi:glutamate-5-semialdehyde dehydrogenase